MTREISIAAVFCACALALSACATHSVSGPNGTYETTVQNPAGWIANLVKVLTEK